MTRNEGIGSAMLGAVMSLLAGNVILAAEPGSSPRFDPAALRAQLEAFNKVPDTPGTGAYPAVKEEVASLPDHVVYRPRDLDKVARRSLGVVAWGNGGCSPDGAGARLHLAEIASHGYLAIANGRILSGPGAPVAKEGLSSATGASTRADQLRDAIDWALAENERKDSPYFELINPHWIAVSGWSCGGVQALRIGADPRVATVIAHNTGIFSSPPTPPPGVPALSPDMKLTKDALRKLHTPVLYVLGGPADIAYENGMDDFRRIEHLPVMVANLDVGHGGTFLQPNGGAAAQVAVKWLDWRLKADEQAGTYFTGKDCGICADSPWTVERKGF